MIYIICAALVLVVALIAIDRKTLRNIGVLLFIVVVLLAFAGFLLFRLMRQ